MKTFKKLFIFFFLISSIIVNSNLIAYANVVAPLPTAKVFTEGIYHFDNSVVKIF